MRVLGRCVAGASVLAALGMATAAGGRGVRLLDAVTVDSPGNSYAVAAADVTGDGVGDLVFGALGSSALKLHAGRADGGFDSPVDIDTGLATPWFRRMHAAELNGDGVTDLVVASGGLSVTLVLSDGEGGHTTVTSQAAGEASEIEAPTVADWDGDGDVDVVTASTAGVVRLRANDGAGTFSAPSTLATFAGRGFDVAASDVDGDGARDLAVGGDGRILVFWRDGDGLADPDRLVLPSTLPVQGLVAADLDGDGLEELVTSWATIDFSVLSLFRQTAARTFAEPIHAPADVGATYTANLVAADLDGDGRPELVTVGQVFVNRGDGTFGTPLRLPPLAGSAVAVGDVVGDGRPDVVLAGPSQGRVYETTDPNREPRITAIAPSTLLRGQTATLLVDGSAFDVGVEAGAGPGVVVNAVRRISPERLEADVSVSATAPLGPAQFAVSVPSGCSATAEYVVWDGTAVVTDVQPSEARPGDTLDVTLVGTGFVPGATATFGDGVTVASATVLDATRLRLSVTLAVDAAPGRRDVVVVNGVVVNGAGASSTAPGAFRVLAPRPLDVVVRRGRLRASFGPGRGTFLAAGDLSSAEDASFDPATEPARLVLGDAASPLTLDVPAQAGWRVSRRRAQWRSSPGATPRVAFDLDRRRGTFRIAVARADLATPADGLVLVEMRLGGDLGRALDPWTAVRPGTLTFR